MDLFIERVGTKDKVADLPSREERTLLRKWGAEEVAPELPHDAWDLKQWISVAGMQHCASSVLFPPLLYAAHVSTERSCHYVFTPGMEEFQYPLCGKKCVRKMNVPKHVDMPRGAHLLSACTLSMFHPTFRISGIKRAGKHSNQLHSMATRSQAWRAD